MAEPKPNTKKELRAAVQRELEPPTGSSAAPPAIPDHELLRQIGSGAYGDVWLARSALGTLRAVKVVYRARFDDEHPYQREFNGILKYEPVSRTHEGLVAVLHVGRNDDAGCFYYVMELADDANALATDKPAPGESGPVPPANSLPEAYVPRTLRTEITRRERLPVAEAAQWVLRLAGALGHLHAHGLVHRDIKPGNVIFVGGQPKLADIGLVTAAGDSRSFVGTEGFIPPEGPGTAQADLYGLGKLLYELATGRDRMDFPMLPPGTGESADGEALLELNEVMTRACAPEVAERYQNAAELQADLNLFLAGRSLRRVRRTEQNVVWLKRFALAVCIILLVAVAAAAISRRRELASQERARIESELRRRAEAAEKQQSALRQEAQQARANEAALRVQAEAQELAARKKAYASDMNLLRQALAADDLGRAQDLLNRQRPAGGQRDLRGWEWRYFWQFCQSDAAYTLTQRSNSVCAVSFSHDGTLLAVGTRTDEVTVWDLASRKMVFHKPESSLGFSRLAFAPTNGLLAYYDANRTSRWLVVWDSETRKEARRMQLTNWVRDLAFSRDGRLFTAEFGLSNNVTAWDISCGAVLQRFSAILPAYGMGTLFGVSGDGARFAQVVGAKPNSVRVATPDGGPGRQFRVAEELTTAVAFSQDGRVLATGAGYAEGAIKLWDSDTGESIDQLEGHRSWVSSLKLMPDGRTLASASADRTIRLWDLPARRPLRTLRGHSGELWTIDVSPDGRWVASGCKDGSVILWDLNSSASRPPPYRTVQPEETETWNYSADSRLIGVICKARLILFDAATLQPARDPAPSLTNAFTFDFSRDMRLLAVTDWNAQLLVYEWPGLRLVTNFLTRTRPARGADLAFLPGNKSLLTIAWDQTAREWNISDWRQIGLWDLSSNAFNVVPSSKARVIAALCRDDLIEVVRLDQPESRVGFQSQPNDVRIDISPDGTLVAAASENGTVELWETQPLRRRALLHGVLLGYHSVAFSGDGERLAAGSNGQEAIKIWDPDSLEEVATLPGEGSAFNDVAFSPDGNSLGARNWNGVIHIWTAPSWKEIEAREAAHVAGDAEH